MLLGLWSFGVRRQGGDSRIRSCSSSSPEWWLHEWLHFRVIHHAVHYDLGRYYTLIFKYSIFTKVITIQCDYPKHSCISCIAMIPADQRG